jgi:hypothetical protein
MKDVPRKLTRIEVDAALAKGDEVHTFKQAGPVLLGCHWPRAGLLRLAETNGAELAGPAATKALHGVVVFDGNEPMFCETDAAALAALGEDAK